MSRHLSCGSNFPKVNLKEGGVPGAVETSKVQGKEEAKMSELVVTDAEEILDKQREGQEEVNLSEVVASGTGEQRKEKEKKSTCQKLWTLK